MSSDEVPIPFEHPFAEDDSGGAAGAEVKSIQFLTLYSTASNSSTMTKNAAALTIITVVDVD